MPGLLEETTGFPARRCAYWSLWAEGEDTTGLGVCGIEKVCYNALAKVFDGGIIFTGNHNLAEENGVKFVRGGVVPLSGHSGLNDIRDRALELNGQGVAVWAQAQKGRLEEQSYRRDRVHFLSCIVATVGLRPLKIHANPGNGCVRLLLCELVHELPYTFSYSNMEPDGMYSN